MGFGEGFLVTAAATVAGRRVVGFRVVVVILSGRLVVVVVRGRVVVL